MFARVCSVTHSVIFLLITLFFLLIFALIYRNLGFFLILENTKFFFRPRIFGKSIFAAALNKIKYSIKFGFFWCLVIALRLLSFWSVTHVSVAKISTMQKKEEEKENDFGQNKAQIKLDWVLEWLKMSGNNDHIKPQHSLNQLNTPLFIVVIVASCAHNQAS